MKNFGSAFFRSRPVVKDELTRENGKKTANTRSASYVRLLVQKFLPFG